MKASVAGSIKLSLDLEITMEELARLPEEDRNKILGWVSNSLKKISLMDVLPALPEPEQKSENARVDENARRLLVEGNHNKCRKCGDYYASKRHQLCRQKKAGGPNNTIRSNGVMLGDKEFRHPEYPGEPIRISELKKQGGSLMVTSSGERIVSMPLIGNEHSHVWKIPPENPEEEISLGRCAGCGQSQPMLN